MDSDGLPTVFLLLSSRHAWWSVGREGSRANREKHPVLFSLLLSDTVRVSLEVQSQSHPMVASTCHDAIKVFVANGASLPPISFLFAEAPSSARFFNWVELNSKTCGIAHRKGVQEE
ncbi:hypothetical protein B0T22DRAFT_441161 [Podospora appendiculata]|uniref:Uncharacterized protein n=1 Tax=Podospora appendiculata TaxID=314037 RepID=A0AAE1CDK6_9PEZI|nr:hypothetical protein B0T22DRAFT_441161 [Podospora appendiculata]